MIIQKYSDWYWEVIGPPLSVFKGAIAETFSFSLTEALLYVELFFVFLLIQGLLKKKRTQTYFALPGALILAVSMLSQGASSFDPLPSAWRTPVEKINQLPEVDSLKMETILKDAQDSFLVLFDSNSYQRIQLDEWLLEANQLADSAFVLLGYPKPMRHIGKIKPLQGLIGVLGLAYGGPGYHDPLTGEVALATEEQYPTPHFFKITGYLHEVVHAKGISNEMQTEIFTCLALLLSNEPTIRSLGYQMMLQKRGIKYQIPQFLLDERLNSSRKFKEVRQRQTAVLWIRQFLRTIGVMNNHKKYGHLKKKSIPKEHPFFRSVQAFSQFLEKTHVQ